MSEQQMNDAAEAPTATALVTTALDALARLEQQAEAVDRFVHAWTSSGLVLDLAPVYGCTLTCEEAETLANLLQVFGYQTTADGLLADHTAHDRCGDLHHLACGTCSNTGA